MVEAEANYAAAQLLFLQERFAAEARDTEITFTSTQALAKRYGNTLTSTLWRIVEEREPDRPVFAIVSTHPRHPTIGAQEDGRPVRHFIRSRAFRQRFPNMTPEDGFAILQPAFPKWARLAPEMLLFGRSSVNRNACPISDLG
jgi:hypothetical protein